MLHLFVKDKLDIFIHIECTFDEQESSVCVEHHSLGS